mmetsp:Transcript_11336/g.25785  ORF Transcript_11336/g.25785 Transcript_11336/m.25785 type:complete len:257 (+) Transcript_11336:69-839(+)
MDVFDDSSMGTVSLASEPARPAAAAAAAVPVQHSFASKSGYVPPTPGAANDGMSAQSPMPGFASQQSSPGVSLQDSMAQQIAGAVARSAADRALGILKTGATELRVFVEKNNYSVQVLSLLGGLALMTFSFVHCIFILEILEGPLAYILNVYQLLFGAIICIIDGPGDKLPYLHSLVIRYAPFLHNNFGRCLFYVFIACLEGSLGSFFRYLIGCYFAIIAVLHAGLKVRSMANGAPAGAAEGVEREEHLLSYTQPA